MISQIRWLQEHPIVRNYLAPKFNLPTGMGSEVVNGHVVSDGRTAKQIYDAFTIKALQDFTGSDLTDVNVLFNVACEIAKAELGMIPKPDEKPISTQKTHSTESSSSDAGSAAKKGKGGKRGSAKKS